MAVVDDISPGTQPTTLSLFAAAFFIALFAYRYYRWLTYNSIRHIRGPPASSLLLGNTQDLYNQESMGDLDFRLLKEYGTAWRMRAPLGGNVLMLADPKGIQHVLQKSGYNYPKSPQSTVTLLSLSGKSILWAPDGEMHSRHRKVMTPAFSAPQLRSFLPLFRRSASKMTQVLKDQVFSRVPDGKVLKINDWLARTTLDVIGEAAFDFDFGALDETDNDVAKAYHNMFAESQLYPSKFTLLFQAAWTYLPTPILNLVPLLPTREAARFRKTLTVINAVSRQLIREKSKDVLANDATAKDVMSILVRANASENPRTRLNEDEMVSQMSAFTLAGHETAANTISWLLWELCKHPEIQERLRAEVVRKRQEINERGDPDFTMDDLEAMPLLQAAMKETLRYHPIVFTVFRMAGQDDVIPLSHPVVSITGEVISEIPVAKGQIIWSSLASYNRLPDVWGEDAHVWNPMRWIDRNQEKEVKVGMYANLCWSEGLHWLEVLHHRVQAMVVELIEHFRFSLPPGEKIEILRAPTMTMSPFVKGKVNEGFQLPLLVVPVDAAT